MKVAGEEERTALHEFPEFQMVGDSRFQEPSGLREYALLLWRKKLTIVVVAALAVGLVLAYSVITTKRYTATAQLLLEPPISQTLVEANFPTSGVTLPDVPDGIQVIQSTSVADIVARTIPNPPSVKATEVGTTDVLQVAATSPNPQTAAQAANAYASSYISFERKQTLDTFVAAEQQIEGKIDTLQLAINNLNNTIRSAPATANLTPDETQLGSLQTQLANLQDQLQNYQFYATNGTGTEAGQVISQASVPTSPSSPKTLEWTVLALIFGIILGIGVVLLVNALSTNRR